MSDSKPKLPADGTPYAMPIPSVLLIAVDDSVAGVCQTSLPALQIRVRTFDEAKWRIPIARPLVVAIGAMLPFAQSRELTDLAAAVGAKVVHLESCLLLEDARDRLTNAWRAASGKRQE